jgi:glucuronate isomerase
MKIRSGKNLSPQEQLQLRTTILLHLSVAYHQKGWAQQFHLGALRNNNTRLAKKLGPDTGFDSIADVSQAHALAQYLNHLDRPDRLAKTILYNLNPADNEVFASMIGNFNDGSTAGKIQYGAAWWFLDQKDGIGKQLNALSHLGLLSCFIGMVTDSRSFLSFPRHEYFRRILCCLLGQEVESGEIPADEKILGDLIRGICYDNAKKYFNL